MSVVLCMALLPTAVMAADPVVVGWTDVPPFFRLKDDGEPAGFSVELIGRLAQIVGFEVAFRRYRSMQAIARAQIDGDSMLIPGIARLTSLLETNTFSQPIGTTRVRLFIRAADAYDEAMAAPSGIRIGTVPPALGSEPSPLLERNVNVPLPSVATALVKLLAGEIDGLLFPEEMTWSEAHASGLDHRITAVGPPIQAFERVIAIHQSRADLLEPLNAAIAELEASGELADMRQRWFLDSPPPPPDILIVGVTHFPPYNIVHEDGSFSGYSVETLRDLAELAGLKLQFRAITPEEFAKGPRAGHYDMITQAGVSDERRTRMDFTLPVESAPFSIFVRAGEGRRISGLDDLVGRRVGVERVNLAHSIAASHGDLDLTVLDGRDALMPALLSRRVDAVLYPTNAARTMIKRDRLHERIDEIRPPFYISERAPALRLGLGEVRERLNAVIPGYLISERHNQLIAEWLQPRPYWTNDRVRTLILIGVGLVVLLAALLAYSMIFRRLQLARERRRFAAEIAEHIPIGLLLVSPKGLIDFANLEIKDRTPDGHTILAEGQNYKEAIRKLIDRGRVESGGRSAAQMLRLMTEEGLEDGFSREFQLVDGSAFLRTTKRLQSGSTLIMRNDVTEYRRQLRQIENLNAGLEASIRRSDLANAELRAFAYATSHDLKAPTNTLMMAVEALAEGLAAEMPDAARAPETNELLDILRRTTSGMRELIDDILAYTDTVGGDPVREPVDLHAIANDVLEALSADIKKSEAKITLADLPSLEANPTQMRQLLQNLISNAIKFRKAGVAPKVDIAPAPAPAQSIGFKVADNGIGIAPENRDKIFQLFSRINRRQAFPGSGLGLAICQRIALNHGGRIDVRSELGEGTCMTVILEEKRR